MLFGYLQSFDRVNHEDGRMEAYGMVGNLLPGLKNFRNNRCVRARVDGALPDRIDVTREVLQGSVLGSILFLIYMNNLPRLVRCEISLFAVDIKIWSCIHSDHVCRLLRHNLDAFNDWSIRNKLPFNFKKCRIFQMRNFLFPLQTWTS